MKKLCKSVFFFFIVLSYISVRAENDLIESVKNYDIATYSYDLDDECYTYDDPFEKINRPLLYFNGALDYVILRPISMAYQKALPSQLRQVIGNFIDNLTIPFSILNNLLQLNFEDATKNLCVFSINSTYGLGGLFDVTSIRGLKHKKQTFGDTLSLYGVAPGPYLMVPFFGPTNTRDLMDIVFKGHIDPMPYDLMPKYVTKPRPYVKMVHDRSILLGKGEEIISKSADPYVAVKSLAYQKRENAIKYKGKRPRCDPGFYKFMRTK